MDNPIDFKQIASAALSQIEAICSHWLPNGKRSGSEWESGDRSGSEGKSLKVHLSGTKAGCWSDFAAGDRGGDLISLVAYAESCSQLDAARRLSGWLGISTETAAPLPPPRSTTTKPPDKAPEWRPLLPVPIEAPPKPENHHRNGKPDHVYVYLAPSGELLGYVCRWNATATRPRKEFGWLVYAENPTGRREWRWQGFPAPRPLYGLDLLAARPAAPVVVTEGEKAAVAARELLPDYVAITWPGGSKATAKASFSPLRGRELVLWSDADEPGKAAMQSVRSLAKNAGAGPVRWLNLPALAEVRGQGALPQGFDAADLLAEGWSPERMSGFMDRLDALLEPKSKPTAPPPDQRPAESQYHVSEQGLFFLSPGQSGEEPRLIRVADKIEVPALARDQESAGWSPVLGFKDMDGHGRQEIIPRRLFLGDGQDGIKQLADMGLYIEPGRAALDRLKAYIASARPHRRARLCDSLGWHGGAFLLPDGPIGDDSETLIYQGSKRALGVFTPKGTLRQWQTEIAALAQDNYRLTFLLSAAFAGPLLHSCGAASFAVHLVGDSSCGKSAGLAAAGSIWGHPRGTVHSWRSTDNALEYVAAQHNDGLLILDELKEVDPRQAGQIAYMLANAKGKNRAHHAGGLREAISWRIAMLSSGELGLADHLASIGQKSHAGQAVRFIEIFADAGTGLGMWNELRGHADGRALSDHLKAAATRYHGTAGRAFVRDAIIHSEQIQPALERAEDMLQEFGFIPPSAGGQVLRVAGVFALVGAAGELASAWGITPWKKDEAFDAAALMFKQWLATRPTAGNLEEAQILAHVRHLMEKSWQARFVDWRRTTEENADLSRMAVTVDPLGFRKQESYWSPQRPDYRFYVSRERFAEEFCRKAGFKPRRVAALLKSLGILLTDVDAATLKETLPNGDPRSYCILGPKLWEKTENF